MYDVYIFEATNRLTELADQKAQLEQQPVSFDNVLRIGDIDRQTRTLECNIFLAEHGFDPILDEQS